MNKIHFQTGNSVACLAIAIGTETNTQLTTKKKEVTCKNCLKFLKNWKADSK